MLHYCDLKMWEIKTHSNDEKEWKTNGELLRCKNTVKRTIDKIEKRTKINSNVVNPCKKPKRSLSSTLFHRKLCGADWNRFNHNLGRSSDSLFALWSRFSAFPFYKKQWQIWKTQSLQLREQFGIYTQFPFNSDKKLCGKPKSLQR